MQSLQHHRQNPFSSLNNADINPGQACIRTITLCTSKVSQGEGWRFCPKSHSLHASRIDSGMKQPCSSAFSSIIPIMDLNLLSSRSQENRVRTSATCRISYQMNGALSLETDLPKENALHFPWGPKSVPM